MQWSALSSVGERFWMYRKNYQHLNIANIVGFLLFDRNFPRAIRYCISEWKIRCTRFRKWSRNVQQYGWEVRREGTFAAGLWRCRGCVKKGLHEYLDDLQVKFQSLGDTIFETFFSQNKSQLNQREVANDVLSGHESEWRDRRYFGHTVTAGNVCLPQKSSPCIRIAGGKHSFFLMTSGLRGLRDKSLTFFRKLLKRRRLL